MTTDIEKQFFDTFNIEKKQVDCGQLLRLDCEDCKTCKYSVYEYPEITDRILLELICVLTKSKAMLPIICSENTQDLKDEILWDLIKAQTQFKKEIKQQVQALFKERS